MVVMVVTTTSTSRSDEGSDNVVSLGENTKIEKPMDINEEPMDIDYHDIKEMVEEEPNLVVYWKVGKVK